MTGLTKPKDWANWGKENLSSMGSNYKVPKYSVWDDMPQIASPTATPTGMYDFGSGDSKYFGGGLSMDKLNNIPFNKGMQVNTDPWKQMDAWGEKVGSAPSILGDKYGDVGSLGGEQKGIMSGFLQQRDGNGATYGGYGTAGMQLAQGLGNAWLGMKQYGVAKDSLNESKRQFGLNFGAQQKMTNMQIEDRMTLAKAEGRDGSYMEKYKV